MKSWTRAFAKLLWRLAAPLHRPLLRRFDNYLSSRLARELACWLAQPLRELSSQTTTAHAQHLEHVRDLNQTLRDAFTDQSLFAESIVRELVRLQMQVESLQHAVWGGAWPQHDSAARELDSDAAAQPSAGGEDGEAEEGDDELEAAA